MYVCLCTCSVISFMSKSTFLPCVWVYESFEVESYAQHNIKYVACANEFRSRAPQLRYFILAKTPETPEHVRTCVISEWVGSGGIGALVLPDTFLLIKYTIFVPPTTYVTSVVSGSCREHKS